MKTLSIKLFLLGMIFIVLFTANSNAAMVGIYFDYDSAEAGISAEVMMFDGEGGFIASDSQNTTEYGLGSHTIGAYATGNVENPPGSGYWEVVDGGTSTETDLGYMEDVSNGEWIELHSTCWVIGGGSNPYDSMYYGQATTQLLGSIVLGTNQTYPAGASGLALAVNATDVDENCGLDWHLILYSDDLENPILATLDPFEKYVEINVLAGQVVEVDLWFHGDSNFFEDTDAYAEVTANITIIPEPATLFILALGSLVLRKRK